MLLMTKFDNKFSIVRSSTPFSSHIARASSKPISSVLIIYSPLIPAVSVGGSITNDDEGKILEETGSLKVETVLSVVLDRTFVLGSVVLDISIVLVVSVVLDGTIVLDGSAVLDGSTMLD